MKSAAAAGSLRSNWRDRTRRITRFAALSSCARHFLRHLSPRSLCTMRLTDDLCISVSLEIWRAVRRVCGTPSWLRIKSSTASIFSAVRAVFGLPPPGCRSVVPYSRNRFSRCVHRSYSPTFIKNSLTSFLLHSCCIRTNNLLRWILWHWYACLTSLLPLH